MTFSLHIDAYHDAEELMPFFDSMEIHLMDRVFNAVETILELKSLEMIDTYEVAFALEDFLGGLCEVNVL